MFVLFSTLTGASKRSVKWANLAKFVLAFLNFWTDVLFAVLVYEEYEKEEDDILFILCVCTITVILFSWIDQLTLCYRFCNYWLREETWGCCPKINASYVETRYLQHHGPLKDYLKRSESKLRLMTAVSRQKTFEIKKFLLAFFNVDHGKFLCCCLRVFRFLLSFFCDI